MLRTLPGAIIDVLFLECPGACFSLVVLTISLAFIEYNESEYAKSSSRIVFIVSFISFFSQIFVVLFSWDYKKLCAI